MQDEKPSDWDEVGLKLLSSPVSKTFFCFLFSGVLSPPLCQPPPPCGEASAGGAAAQRQARTSLHQHGSYPARRDSRAPESRHQPEPEHQQRHLPLPGVEASERRRSQSSTPPYLGQPTHLQGRSRRLCSTIQACSQRHGWQQQAHIPVWALVCDWCTSWPAILLCVQ